MNGLPPEFTESSFVGAKVESLGFTENTIHVCFDKPLTITLNAYFAHRRSREAPLEAVTVLVQESALPALVGQEVVAASLSQDRRRLVLSFLDGQELHCLDEDPRYHSFWIETGEGCHYS